MLATSENVLFPGHNHLLTTGTIMTLHSLALKCQVISTGGYDLEIGYFQKWLAWWLPSAKRLFCIVYNSLFFKLELLLDPNNEYFNILTILR